MNKEEIINDAELAYSEGFWIRRKDDGYEVECVEDNLGAFISNDNKITYYITGCFDSGDDWINFDIKILEKLKNFCEWMAKK